MAELHAALAARVDAWRADGYPHERSPTIAEILHFAVESEDPDAPYPASGTHRYLRAAQFRALETYWYLRLVEGRPRVAREARPLLRAHAGQRAHDVRAGRRPAARAGR